MQEAISTWLYFIPNVYFSISLIIYERKAARSLLFYGLLEIACSIIRDEVLFKDSSLICIDVFASLSFSALLISAVILGGRRIALYRSRQLVSHDKKKYDQLWGLLMRDTVFERQIADLKETLSSFDTTKRICRQLNRIPRQMEGMNPTASTKLLRTLTKRYNQRQRKKISFDVGAGASGEAGTLDPSSPLKSLDQLFFQAYGVYPVFLAKIQVLPRCFIA